MRRRRHEGVEYHVIAADVGVSIKNVIECVKGLCWCDTQVDPVTNDSPWREQQVLETLRIDENLNLREIAELLDCHTNSVINWSNNYAIESALLDYIDNDVTEYLLDALSRGNKYHKGKHMSNKIGNKYTPRQIYSSFERLNETDDWDITKWNDTTHHVEYHGELDSQKEEWPGRTSSMMS